MKDYKLVLPKFKKEFNVEKKFSTLNNIQVILIILLILNIFTLGKSIIIIISILLILVITLFKYINLNRKLLNYMIHYVTANIFSLAINSLKKDYIILGLLLINLFFINSMYFNIPKILIIILMVFHLIIRIKLYKKI